MLKLEVELKLLPPAIGPTHSPVSFTGPAWFAITLLPNPGKRLGWESRGFMGPFTRAPPTLAQPSTHWTPTSNQREPGGFHPTIFIYQRNYVN